MGGAGRRGYVRSDGGLLWTPALDTGLIAWYRADLETTLVATKTSVRGDLWVNSRDASQGTDATRPTWNAANSNMGNKASDDFAPTQFLRTAVFAVAQPFTVILVLRNNDAPAAFRVAFDQAT